MTIKIYLAALVTFLSISNGICENLEAGLPFIQSFTPEQYGALGQNTDIIQDKDGIIYIANQGGILEYDGVSWRLHEHPDGIQPLSLAITKDDDIYAGFTMDLCKFVEDSLGIRKFVSLLDNLPDSLQKINDAWSTIATPDGIFFMDWLNLYRWKPADNGGDKGKLKRWDFPEDSALQSYNYVNGQHIISRKNTGLLILENKEFNNIPKSNLLKDYDVYEIISFPDNRMLILSSDENQIEHWFISVGNSFKPFRAPIRDFARENSGINCAIYHSDLYALSTTSGGVALFDSTGGILSIMDKKAGLSDNLSVRSMLDDQNGAWILTDYGFSRVTINPTITYFDGRQGLDGTILSINRFDNSLFVGTDQGLFRLNRSSLQGRPGNFTRITRKEVDVWSQVNVADHLVFSGINGIFEVISSPDNKPELITLKSSECLAASLDSSRVYYGHDHKGIGVLRLTGNGWIDEGKIDGTFEEYRELFVDNDGVIWGSVDDNYLVKLKIIHNVNSTEVISRKVFGQDEGLPTPSSLYPFIINDHFYVGSKAGVYEFVKSEENFVLANAFHNDSTQLTFDINSPITDAHGSVWGNSYHLGGIRLIPSGERYLVTQPFKHGPKYDHYVVYPESNDVVWAGGAGGVLVRYTGQTEDTDIKTFNTLIRRVVINSDSTLQAGYIKRIKSPIVLEYNFNSLRIEYAVPRYTNSRLNVYQYRLMGLTQTWSNWSDENYHDYDNLDHGSYKFEVRGKDSYDIEGKAAQFPFIIHPPWYKTVWAYLGYISSVILLLLGLYRWRINRIRKINTALETLVAERTFNLEQSNNNLQSEILERKNTEIALQKSELKFSRLFNHANDAIFIHDMSGNFIEFNEEAINRFGYSRDEFLNLSHMDIDTIDDSSLSEKRIKELNEKGSAFFRVDQVRRDGTHVPSEVSAMKIEFDGKPAILSICRDITEQLLAEEEIASSLSEKEVLLREIHHRVKNNMQVIVSLFRMHARRTKSESMRSIFEDCRNRVNAMSLIHEALYQSENLAQINFEMYLKKLCRNLSLAYGATNKGIEVKVIKCNVALNMDQGIAVGMVISELITNAFKHAFPHKKGGSVSLNLVGLVDDEVALVIEDDGIGLPPEIDIKNSSSFGLKLAIATIIRDLDGSIEIKRDAGTRCIIRFNVVSNEEIIQ